jgi:BolA protein
VTDDAALARWREKLRTAFDPAEVEVSDESHRHAGHLPAGSPARGTHAAVRVVSVRFEGMALPERHRRVYAALGFGREDQVLHALQVRALTPAEAERAERAGRS